MCVLLTIGAVLGTGPLLEMGLNDDWSFAFIARGFAQTGHIAYSGWSAPMLGLQVWWGGLLIRLFGFSFTLLRFSTIPFAAGCSALLYGLGRRSGLNHQFATMASLSLVVSPVFIPLAASFMTDVPALCLWLSTFYFAFRASSERTEHPEVCLTLATLSGFAGGTIRQVVWAAPFLAIPVAAWMRRTQRGFLALAAILWCATLGGAVACMIWYKAQPNHMEIASQPLMKTLSGLPEPIRLTTLACLVAILPVLILSFWAPLNLWRRSLALLIASLLAACAFVAACLWYFEDDLLLGNLVTPYGTMWIDSEAMGHKPVILGSVTLDVLAIVLCLATGLTAAWIIAAWRKRSSWQESGSSLWRLLAIMAPACISYTAAVVFRYATDELLFDRYLIFATPPLVIAILWLYQHQFGETVPRAGWLVLGVFALYGVANAHDYIAAARARLHAANTLLAAGIPRTRISAGLEFDGWTQLESTGRIPSAEERHRDQRTFPIPDPYWFWRMTPSIDPQYIVDYTPVKGLRDSSFKPVQFRAWLPPFRRQVLTQTVP